MENLRLCFNAIMPLLLLMLLGYLLKRIDFIPKAGFDAIDKLCFRIFIPVVLFSNVYGADFSTQFYAGAMGFMAAATLGYFLVAFFITPRVMAKSAKEDITTVIHGACHGNLAVLGMPLISNLFGQEGLAVYSIMLACASPLINACMVFQHLYFRGDRIRPLRLIWNVIKSPFVVGTLAGLACKVLGIQFPVFAQTALSSVKSLATPLCLIGLGGSFAFSNIRQYFGKVAWSVAVKCILIPAVVLGIAVALGFRGLVLASLMVLFCCPSAASTYSFCAGYGGNPPLASQIVVYSTVFSMASMFVWVFAFLQLGLI